jgi:trk system potassium uptake protein TrkH
MNAGLIIFGAVFIFLMEVNNPETLKNLPWQGKIFASFFHSITPRSAGFNTLNMSALSMPTMFMTIVLMFIGGSPGSTAGGIKTTTAGILFFTVLSVVRGRESTELFQRRIPKYLVYRAMSIAIISFFIIAFAAMLLSIAEIPYNNTDFGTLIFEATSAFGIVGLTLDYTPNLTDVGKIIVTLCMFAGRVGPLTLIIALTLRAGKNSSPIRYPEGKIMVG